MRDNLILLLTIIAMGLGFVAAYQGFWYLVVLGWTIMQ